MAVTTSRPLPSEVTVEHVFDVDPEQEVIELAYDITSYGADFLVDGLVARMESGDIVVPTFDPEFEADSDVRGFQRGFVWTKPQADRFLESLLLGMPVPGIFLVREPNGIFLVLDGHQRLRTLAAFYRGIFRGEEYKLEYVQAPWRGLRYEDLDNEDRRRLDSSILHATILRQEERRDYRAVYSIFERINTGGTPLQPQEIRVALFGGQFIHLLRDLNNNEDWRVLYGKRSARLKDQELILRFFALYETAEAYERPLKGFLNAYLASNVDRAGTAAKDLVTTFENTCAAINAGIGRAAFRPVRSLNAAVMDSVMVGVARRLNDGSITKFKALKSHYDELIARKDYLEATVSSTAGEESVAARLTLATAAFRSVI